MRTRFEAHDEAGMLKDRTIYAETARGALVEFAGLSRSEAETIFEEPVGDGVTITDPDGVVHRFDYESD